MTLHRNRGLQTRVESTCAPPSWPVSSKRLYSGGASALGGSSLPPPHTPLPTPSPCPFTPRLLSLAPRPEKPLPTPCSQTLTPRGALLLGAARIRFRGQDLILRDLGSCRQRRGVGRRAPGAACVAWTTAHTQRQRAGCQGGTESEFTGCFTGQRDRQEPRGLRGRPEVSCKHPIM